MLNFTTGKFITSLTSIIRDKNSIISKLIAVCIFTLFPKRQWYKMVFGVSYISRFIIKLTTINKNSLGLVRANNINRLLALLTRSGKSFPIPYRITGETQIEHSSGLILCTVHLPLVKVAIMAFMKSHHVDAVIVGSPTIDNKMGVWGVTERIPVLLSDSSVLLKTKSILAKNGTVVLMVDKDLMGEFSPNIMRLCGKLGAKVMFFFAELKPDGTIDTPFIQAPHPYCESETAIFDNLELMRQTTQEILMRYNSPG